ncbi:Fe-S cluster assembly sulfur transfer protein SufU [Patescibacteria group bacterium]
MDLYQKQIIDHYKKPHNFGVIKSKSKSSHGENPSCGDSITMDILVENDRIKEIKFTGEGCAIFIASASMLTEEVKGEKVTRIAELDFNHIQDMLGIKVNPARKRCAMLPLNILKKVILKELKK